MDSMMMAESKPGQAPDLSWVNVALALSFVSIDAILSVIFNLGIASSLIVAAGRCVLQLSVMGLVLDKVFAAGNIWGVFGIAALLNVLGAIEATFNKSKKRFHNMFPMVLLAMMSSTFPIGVLGSQYAMAERPFWKPNQFVPIIGMILGNAISAIGISVNFVHKEFTENRDKIETYLAMGASRFEACKPIGKEALKLALLPTINQMSVIGLISIPGMMTGALIAGKSVEQAARLQMILIFMISASSAFSCLLTIFFALSTLTDKKHRIRLDRLNAEKPLFYRWRDAAGAAIWKGIRKVGGKIGRVLRVTKRKEPAQNGSPSERTRLLPDEEGR